MNDRKMSSNLVSAFSHAVDRDEPVTKYPCQDSGHFLGNTSLPVINIVDTPGRLNNDGPRYIRGLRSLNLLRTPKP